MILWLRLVTIVLLLLLALPAPAATPDGVKVLRNVAYGPDRLQAMDVYLPPDAKAAPVILMVHGGAWRFGDKRHPPVFESKVARWVPKGFIFVSVNYPMVPESDPVEQADDIARAVAAAQAAAAGWGGDPARHPDGSLGGRAPGVAAERRPRPCDQARRQAVARHHLPRQRRARCAGDHDPSSSAAL